jgi:putative transcriptional regulator
MASLQGHLLVASPSLLDPNFARAVVFLVQHNDDGALGVILNRPSDTPVKSIWKKVTGRECRSNAVVFVGGPVEGPLLSLHANPKHSEVEVIPGIYLCMKQGKLAKVLNTRESVFRFFMGNAGWGPGQLESELADNSWQVIPATPGDVLGSPEDLWDRAHRRATAASIFTKIPYRQMPVDPSWN